MDTISGSKVSLEQVFAILMQHQQIIQGGNFGSALNSTSKQSAIPIQNISIEDQMKNELQMVENVVEDIFGTEEEEQQQQQSLAASKKNTSLGMSMIEQLEKKARRENNKKLVKSREALNKLVEKVLITNFHSDEEAIAFYQRVHLEFEQCGLVLGTDAIQTWSARLLIKNKETREWYFNEKERFDAGKAYQRLWSMSFLERDVGQLITKKKQILNAPETFKVMVKNKLELMEKFIGLLKDAVKIKHKIFKNPLFVEEKKRLQEFDIPEKFEERSKEMIDASIVLAHASLGLAEEEFRVLNRTTRAIKIRASVAVGVAERAISLVEIVKKIGAQGIDEARLQRVQEKMVELQEKYLGTLENEEEEEEDDVL
jgi:hypothetical protein